MLLVRQRRALAGGADRHQAIGALGDLPVDQAAKGLFVERAILNGVTSAVNEPRKLVLAVMIRSSESSRRQGRPPQLISGTRLAMKAPAIASACPVFAAVAVNGHVVVRLVFVNNIK